MAASPRILVILGPTASGKSALAMAVARAVAGAEILSVDSMQVYRGMDVGTAKPAAAERAAVRHHAIDVVDPDEEFTVARFLEIAEAAIPAAAARGVPLVATGGTPLYFKALFDGMFDGPAADDALRGRLRALGNDELYRRLAFVDPAAAERIHVNDTKRLVRALEVFDLTGKPISSLQTEWAGPARRHEAVWVGLHWDREALNRRINARAKQMIADGWADEARDLSCRFANLSRTAAEATGYRQLLAHVRDPRHRLDDAIEAIKIGTRQLARRQMKWFKRFPDVHWLPGDRSPEANLEAVLRLWTPHPPAPPGRDAPLVNAGRDVEVFPPPAPPGHDAPH